MVEGKFGKMATSVAFRAVQAAEPVCRFLFYNSLTTKEIA